MIGVLCGSDAHLKLGELKAFQGNLKKRTDDDVKELVGSLQREGLIMPFVVWRNEAGDNLLLDGHGRLQAIERMAEVDASLLEQDFPVLYVAAKSEQDARKLLLQITSSYGKITKRGAQQFCRDITGYRAPSVNRLLYRELKPKKLEERSMNRIIRISVPEDKAQDVEDLLKQVSYIKVL